VHCNFHQTLGLGCHSITPASRGFQFIPVEESSSEC
jgi:hypothetical protein